MLKHIMRHSQVSNFKARERAQSSSGLQSSCPNSAAAPSLWLQESQPSFVQQLPACSRAVAALSARHIPAWSFAELQRLLEELAQQTLLTPEPAAHAWQTRPTSTAGKRKQPTAPVLALPVLLEEGFVRQALKFSTSRYLP